MNDVFMVGAGQLEVFQRLHHPADQLSAAGGLPVIGHSGRLI